MELSAQESTYEHYFTVRQLLLHFVLFVPLPNEYRRASIEADGENFRKCMRFSLIFRYFYYLYLSSHADADDIYRHSFMYL